MRFLLILCALACSSCAAVYTYDHETADGQKCSVNIYSRREVGGPVSFEADKDCGVKAGTGNLTGGQLSGSDAILQSLVDRLLPVTPKADEPK